MKTLQIAALCAMLFAFCSPAWAQWIIDGQQVQTLNLNVSDPQALYTDGSREMTAPLVFSEACSAPTSSIFQITVPWLGGVKEFFVFDESYEYLKLCDGPLNLEVGGLVLSSAGINSAEFPGRLNFEEGVLEFGEEANISTEEGTLDGNWYVTGVAADSSSIINRGYADDRYLRSDIKLTAPLEFANSVTQTSSLFRVYNPWQEETTDFLIFNTDGEWVELGTGLTALKIGDTVFQSGGMNRSDTGKQVNIEEGCLYGGWATYSVLDDDRALMNRSYADTRYLRGDIDLTAPLTFALGGGTPTNPVIRMHIPMMGSGLQDCFYFDETEEGIRLCEEPVALLIDALRIESENISLGSKQIGMDTGRFYGNWETMSVPDSNFAIMNRSYTDSRYLKRTEGVTTNHTFQAGDVLQIQNGIITAINP